MDIRRKRILYIQELIKKHNCDAFLSFCPVDNRYLSGFTGSTSAILITNDNPYFLSDFRYEEQAFRVA